MNMMEQSEHLTDRASVDNHQNQDIVPTRHDARPFLTSLSARFMRKSFENIRYRFDSDQLQPARTLTGNFPSERFYNYPNPVLDGNTTITYWLNEEASSVSLAIYDLSGREVKTFSGLATGSREENEVTWDCSSITPGVYRCVINVDFAGSTETAFTDIAVIR